MKKEDLNKQEYRKLLNMLCVEYCDPERHCILKEFLVSSHPSPRMLIQLKCLEKFKWDLSEEAKKDVGMDETIRRWVDDGFAKRFAEVYDSYDDSDDIKVSAIYKKIMKSNGN